MILPLRRRLNIGDVLMNAPIMQMHMGIVHVCMAFACAISVEITKAYDTRLELTASLPTRCRSGLLALEADVQGLGASSLSIAVSPAPVFSKRG